MENIMEYAYYVILPILKQKLGGMPIIPHLSTRQAILFDVFASPKRMQIIMMCVIDKVMFEVRFFDGQTVHQPYQNLDQNKMLECIGQLMTTGKYTNKKQHEQPVDIKEQVVSINPQPIQPIQPQQPAGKAQILSINPQPIQPQQQQQQAGKAQVISATPQPIQPQQQVGQAQILSVNPQPIQPIQPGGTSQTSSGKAQVITPLQPVKPKKPEKPSQEALKPIQPTVVGVPLKPVNVQDNVDLPKIVPNGGSNENDGNQQQKENDWGNINKQAQQKEKERQEKEAEAQQGISMEDDNDIDGNEKFKADFKGMIKDFNKGKVYDSEVMNFLKAEGLDTEKNINYFKKYAKKTGGKTTNRPPQKK